MYPPTPDWSGAKRSEHFAPNEAFGVTTESWTHGRKSGSSQNPQSLILNSEFLISIPYSQEVLKIVYCKGYCFFWRT